MVERHVKDGELVVPEGNYFVLGDDRDDSFDSRYWGLVPRENIIGTLVMIYDSHDTVESGSGRSAPPTVRNERWGRLFKLL